MIRMKQLSLIMVCLFALQTIVRADNARPITITQMPQKAQQFIRLHFADSQVALAKVETDFLEKSYEVFFTDGNKLEFDKKGEWKEVSCKSGAVPQDIVPEAIRQHVASLFPEARIVKMEREKSLYEVTLTNGQELKYNTRFQLIDIDD